ncbi:hypothetical protein AB0K08_13685 [Citricoccus sp. NPDC055426]|uniref:hypothetical protein n=1 Tax=Citricoccus sp. NPDC055426 TaxID=3155536 RepID=UPI0034299A40
MARKMKSRTAVRPSPAQLQAGTYQVVFPIDDQDMPVGQLKEAARELVSAAADDYGLRRVGSVQTVLTHGTAPFLTAQVAVQWAGSQPVIRGWL